jgi:hypothetical protein
MADHIKIDTSTLDQTAAELKRLHDDFNGSTGMTDHYSGYMGSGEVADAMHSFATDWSKKRDTLVTDLDTLAQIADAASKAWDGLDKDLAKALTDAASKTGK